MVSDEMLKKLQQMEQLSQHPEEMPKIVSELRRQVSALAKVVIYLYEQSADSELERRISALEKVIVYLYEQSK